MADTDGFGQILHVFVRFSQLVVCLIPGLIEELSLLVLLFWLKDRDPLRNSREVVIQLQFLRISRDIL